MAPGVLKQFEAKVRIKYEILNPISDRVSEALQKCENYRTEKSHEVLLANRQANTSVNFSYIETCKSYLKEEQNPATEILFQKRFRKSQSNASLLKRPPSSGRLHRNRSGHGGYANKDN